MAIKRTKRQKQRNSVRREETLAYSIDEIQSINEAVVVNKSEKNKIITKVKKNNVSSGFDTSYVLKDLSKTLIVTVMVVGVLVAYTIFGQ